MDRRIQRLAVSQAASQRDFFPLSSGSAKKMYNKGWNLRTCSTPCLEMAMFFFKCCSFCSCQLAKEWREKMINYVYSICTYRTVVINDNPVHIFTGQASKNPCLLDFANTRKKTHPATAKIHFISPASGAKDMPRNPSPTGQPTRWSKATQLLFFNRLPWSKHATSRMSIILNTSPGDVQIQPIFSNLLGPEQRP